MAKVYLQPGEAITLNLQGARVGASGTVVDLLLECRNDGAEGIGTVVKAGRGCEGGPIEDGFTFNVWMEEQSGRLWYDDESGF
jgi:hypothetical protein